jgi:serine/threonine-protein kinase ULK/ATG1
MKLSSNTSVSPQVRDLLERMLIFDPKKRIDWDELFNHPVTRMQEEKIQKELESTMKN